MAVAERVADAHNDLVLELAHRVGEPNPFAEHWLPKLRDGGVAVQVCPLCAGLEHLPESGTRVVLEQIGAFLRAVRLNGAEVLHASRDGDLERAEAEGKIALVLSMEGVEPFGYSPRMLVPFVELGVRMIGLTWNRRNPFADGVGERGDGGLSEIGRQVVTLMEEHHVAIDLAHASPRTVAHVLETTSEDAHLLISHTGLRSCHETTRNVSDAQVEAVAARGGLVGVMAHPVSVGLDGPPTIDKVIDHMDRAVSLAGVEHVAVGADFARQLIRSGAFRVPPDIIMPPGMAFDAAIEGLEGPHEFPALAARMAERGYSDADRAAILHDNLRRFLGEVLSHHRQAA